MNTLISTTETRNSQHIRDIIEFYDEATSDYSYWSKNLNMHYGFLRKFSDFFHRERMLENMNLEVFKRLNPQTNGKFLDAGCGTGATSRALVSSYNSVEVTALNIVKSHILRGKELNRTTMGNERITMVHGDYQHIPFAEETFNGIFFMESLCHATNKFQVLKECSRTLKSGGKIVIADCFLRNPNRKMSAVTRWAYSEFRRCWSVPHLAEINHFQSLLTEAGFQNITTENLRWQVAPSVFHSPFIVLQFLINRFLKGQKNQTQTRKNLKAVLLSIIIGLSFRNFSYYMVSAEKK
ncbi:MAG: methyltransferase domain-containing protein [Bacteroidetes bacterium]|nr:methyltransferase domain-containing protein [Bacteroidota bacterium]